MKRSIGILNAVVAFNEASFPALLNSLLEDHNKTRGHLFNYLIQQDYWMTQTAMYKYFNTSDAGGRIPNDYKFIILFAAFLELSEDQTDALLHVWAVKRSRKQHPWERDAA